MYIYAFCEQGIGKHKKLYCFKYNLDNGQYKLVGYVTNFY